MAAPLPRGATLQWRCCVTPSGQVDKRPSAVLLALAVEWLPRRTSAFQLAAYRFAESVNIMLEEY